MVTEVPHLAPRPANANKGNFGKVLIVAGSRGMTGAAVLAGSAALRSGAGLVRVAIVCGALDVVAGGNPCYTTISLPQDECGRLATAAGPVIVDLAKDNDVLAVGPGLGRSPEITAVITTLLAHVQIPVVLDADSLNALAAQLPALHRHAMPLIVTPHPGEFARLLDTDVQSVQSQRVELACRFAQEHNLVVVLKGHGTIVTDGRQLYRNTTGNPGMATGGTGDVLTGLIAALVGQKLAPFDAACLGVFVHGLAGDLARKKYGEVSLIATDLIDLLPQAFTQA
jgi:NAD(P)H-hydrate epimerase